jgi:cytochrome P450
MVVLCDLEAMNYVQVFKPLHQHPSADSFLAPIVGHNVVAVANGPTWKMLRNAMNPSFAPGHVKALSGVIVEECLTFRSTLFKLAATGEIFNMEEKGAELIFDVIARIVFNFPLEAQKKGSQALDDLRELVQLTEAGMSLNPLDKLRVWWRRDALTKRLNKEVRGKILERYDLLRSEKVVPSRKDPFSTLDLMLREQLMHAEGVKDLDPEFEKLLLSKYCCPPLHNNRC